MSIQHNLKAVSVFVSVLSASVLLHTKLHQIHRDVFSAKCSRAPQGDATLATERPCAGRGRQAQCGLGVVVKAGQRRRGCETVILRNVPGIITRCERQEEEPNAYLDPGSHAGAPDTRGGEQREEKCQRPHEMPWWQKCRRFRCCLPWEGLERNGSVREGFWERTRA